MLFINCFLFTNPRYYLIAFCIYTGIVHPKIFWNVQKNIKNGRETSWKWLERKKSATLGYAKPTNVYTASQAAARPLLPPQSDFCTHRILSPFTTLLLSHKPALTLVCIPSAAALHTTNGLNRTDQWQLPTRHFTDTHNSCSVCLWYN